MKNIITTTILLLGIIANGQTKEFTYNLQGITRVEIETDAKIEIKATDTSDLVISEDANINNENFGDPSYNLNDKHEKPLAEKTKGLTAIYPGGKDNTNGFGFSIKKEDKTLIVKDLKSHFQRKHLLVLLPKNINVTIDIRELGSVKIKGFTSEIEAGTIIGAIDISNVTGPITAHSDVGNINIDFSKVNQTSPITISTNVSEIDVTMPTNTKANLELNTKGSVYTNFDMEIPQKEGLNVVRENKKIETVLNSGGVKIKLKSSLGNIYLRKK